MTNYLFSDFPDLLSCHSLQLVGDVLPATRRGPCIQVPLLHALVPFCPFIFTKPNIYNYLSSMELSILYIYMERIGFNYASNGKNRASGADCPQGQKGENTQMTQNKVNLKMLSMQLCCMQVCQQPAVESV
jgi:hypothetical protein